MSISNNYNNILLQIPNKTTLITVTKTQNIERLKEVYNAGSKSFGENRVQELLEKQPLLPNDIEWHLIGHLQTNKVKFIAPFIHLIHSVDSIKLLKEINNQAIKNDRVINCLLQIYIAQENTKFGLSIEEAKQLLNSEELNTLNNINITGFMGMATNTDSINDIKTEFNQLNEFYINQKKTIKNNINIDTLSMGMSSDYKIAIQAGSTMIRVGSNIFGKRN
jgi:pyridoxal phosphate enzyme (YggS family)